MKLVAIDTEFFDSNEYNMIVVAAVLQYDQMIVRYNLLDQAVKQDFIKDIKEFNQKGYTFVSYAAIAEARALMSLGVEPMDLKWIDLYIEFIMLCNSNNKFAYGNYISKTGNIAYSVPPDPSMTDEEKDEDTQDHAETPKNLINCAYKILNIRLDAEEKDAMRDLILSKDLLKIYAQMGEILDYCVSDTMHLIGIYNKICREFELEGLQDFLEDQLSRGRYAVAVAKSERLGIPIDFELLQKVIDKTPDILKIHEEEVNKHFNFFVPETHKPDKVLKNGKVFVYKPVPAHKDMASYQTYVETLKIKDFPKTKTGKYKSDKDTLETWGYWGGLESLWKYNKMESSLKWFRKDNKNGFFERVGSDKVVRPYYGLFGTQTGRNAAKAKTFPLAMSSWLRAIVRPQTADQVIIGCDFSQQEVYVAAILSGDINLYDAYKSGDVYLAFAKQAGLVPETATKSSHKLERMLCKSTVLGLQFGMGHNKLKTKLSLDSGQEVSDEKTQELINAHKMTYSAYWDWVKNVSKQYKQGIPLSTSDGWVLFCDNPVMTSVRNFLVQATAASITRAAVVKCWEVGLKVMCSLHDALYVISNKPEDSKLVEEIMLWATEKILKEKQTLMRIDTKVVTYNDTWIEEKAQQDWDKLKEFFV